MFPVFPVSFLVAPKAEREGQQGTWKTCDFPVLVVLSFDPFGVRSKPET